MTSLPKSEVAANIAICCMAVALVAMGTWQVVRSSAKTALAPTELNTKLYKVGDTFDIPVDVPLDKWDATVLLVVQSQCRYCEESIPFYKRLVEKRAASGNRVQLVGLVFDPLAIGKAYLEEAGVAVDAVNRYPLQRMDRVSGTPTIWVVDRSRRIVGAWYGKLDTKQEAEVERLLGVE